MSNEIGEGDLVLEVGSGDDPCPRADVLVDKYLDESSEMEANRSLLVDRPLVIAEGEHLPFRDKSFDFVIASHVLEHTDNPRRFLKELVRVSRRGYIETPLALRERVFDWSFHKWYVYFQRGRIIMIKKTRKSKKFYLGMSASLRSELYHLEGSKLLNMCFWWNDNVDFAVVKSEPEQFLIGLDRQLMRLYRARKTNRRYWIWKLKPLLLAIPTFPRLAIFARNLIHFAKKRLERKMVQSGTANRKNAIDLHSLVVCPVCKSDLAFEKSSLQCPGCGGKFRVFQGKIPILTTGD